MGLSMFQLRKIVNLQLANYYALTDYNKYNKFPSSWVSNEEDSLMLLQLAAKLLPIATAQGVEKSLGLVATSTLSSFPKSPLKLAV